MFTRQPTDVEISNARIFGEPLVPVGRGTLPEENRALAEVAQRYLEAGNGEQVLSFWSFLKQFPDSPWKATLLLNIGITYRRTGYFSRALDTWESAWALTKVHSDPRAKAIADRAVGELLELHARLGRFDRLDTLLKEIEGRPIVGRATEQVTAAREGLWLMRNRPDQAFRCGPMAVDQILAATRAEYRRDTRITESKSTSRGTSLLQMRQLASALELPMQIARRSLGAEPLLPALVHWRAGHFAALIREEGGRYLVRDPTFGDEMWISRAALDDESTGFMLVPEGSLPAGWRAVTDEEGGAVWGKGHTDGNDPKRTRPCDRMGGGCDGTCGNSSKGMPVYTAHLMVVSLNVQDTPVGYVPPRGPDMNFTITYNQREAFQPQTFFYSHLGPKWTYGWLSFIEDDPANPSALVHLAVRGGGSETYQGLSALVTESFPEPLVGAVVVRTSTTPIQYERRLKDGSVETFAQPDGALVSPRRIFMTSWRDANGNTVTFTYDAQLRLVGATDALGQVTTFEYAAPEDSRRITRVTDPFGRSAVFAYDASGRLNAITDLAGMQSTFVYDAGDFITSMTTPYGTTRFAKGENGLDRWLEMTDPLGGKDRIEYRVMAPVPDSDPAVTVPSVPGVTFTNSWLQYRNTFVWNTRAMAVAPRDLASAHIIHWLHAAGPLNQTSGIVESERRPLENRVWFAYPGQTWTNVEGTLHKPSVVARVLDDGTTQAWRMTYTTRGLLTSRVDPVGRRTSYSYAANGVDLFEVKQTTGTLNDLLVRYTDYTTNHEPQSIVEASGQQTALTYGVGGRIATITNAKGETTTFTYDASGNGYLQSVTGSIAGSSMSFTYDAYGRLLSRTESDGRTIVFAYDALDRVTTITYPDGTFEQMVYDRLDLVEVRDRLGRRTRWFHDSLRRLVAERDDAGRTVTHVWCACGSLDAVIDANGRKTTWTRDVQGRVLTEKRAHETTLWTYTYETTTSRLKAMTDPRLQVKTFTYNLDDTAQSTVYTNAQVATPSVMYAYDQSYRRLSSMTDGTGTSSYTYHPSGALGAGKLASVDGPLSNDLVTYSYDELGRSVGRTLNGVTTTTQYDGLGRISTLTNLLGTFVYGYDGATNRVNSIAYPSGLTVAYEYFGSAGDYRLKKIAYDLPSSIPLLRFDYTYDAVGNVITWRHQAGSDPVVEWRYAYDRADQLVAATKVTAGASPAVLQMFAYAYDPAGNRTSVQNGASVNQSSYDSLNRLLGRQAGGRITISGTVSEPATVAVGNMPLAVSSDLRFTGSIPVTSGTSPFSVVATDASGNMQTKSYEIDIAGPSTTFTHDANGNLTSDGVRMLEWDAENRLVRILGGSTELASFAYDGRGRRTQKIASGTTHTYVYDGDHVAEERLTGSVTGTAKPFIGLRIDDWLGYADAAGPHFFVKDHLGSIARELDDTNAVNLFREYGPWGEMTQGEAFSGVAFAGRDWDAEAGLYHFRARYYDPVLGRFASEDPIGFEGGNNFYTYVAANPINVIDPFGLAPSGLCCAQSWLECVDRCYKYYDNLGPIGDAALTALGGVFPKAAIGAPAALGSSRMTTVPSAVQHAAARAGFTIKWLRPIGRAFAPIWVAYGNYLFAVGVHCFAACAGYPCYY